MLPSSSREADSYWWYLDGLYGERKLLQNWDKLIHIWNFQIRSMSSVILDEKDR